GVGPGQLGAEANQGVEIGGRPLVVGEVEVGLAALQVGVGQLGVQVDGLVEVGQRLPGLPAADTLAGAAQRFLGEQVRVLADHASVPRTTSQAPSASDGVPSLALGACGTIFSAGGSLLDLELRVDHVVGALAAGRPGAGAGARALVAAR